MSSKPPKKKQRQEPKQQQVPPALKVFSKNRDLDVSNPYHLDGDMQMYSQQKIEERKSLADDPDVRRQLQGIVKLYEVKDGKIYEDEYKRMQRKMALVLRPDIDEEELQFVVDQDWELDNTDGCITEQNMVLKIFELVDVWTLGVDKMEYITFIKLLGKKLGRKKAEKKDQADLSSRRVV